ncbi:MAG: hypothetical protein A2136_10760 [Chloroflexi bacterium RBG_16_54_11]|nr:MAG: hypothetical protein A2136_10760 [Chloroflexi bacterium RBG_16_54_11]
MRILILVTKMPEDGPLVSFGGLVAKLTQSSLTLLHVAPSKAKQERTDQVLNQAADLLAGLEVERRLCWGKPATMAILEMRQGNYDLIVIGARQASTAMEQSLSLASRAILQRAPCSVLVVRGGSPQLQRVLICTAGTDLAEPVITAGAFLSRAAGAQVTLLHVAGTIPTMYTGLSEIEETLPELLKTDTPIARHLRRSAELLASYQITAQVELRHGLVTSEILREAHLSHIDLIILGSPSRGLRRWFLGDVALRVAENAPCSVLVVKGSLPVPSTSV